MSDERWCWSTCVCLLAPVVRWLIGSRNGNEPGEDLRNSISVESRPVDKKEYGLHVSQMKSCLGDGSILHPVQYISPRSLPCFIISDHHSFIPITHSLKITKPTNHTRYKKHHNEVHHRPPRPPPHHCPRNNPNNHHPQELYPHLPRHLHRHLQIPHRLRVRRTVLYRYRFCTRCGESFVVWGSL
jgi:hypothetical protein